MGRSLVQPQHRCCALFLLRKAGLLSRPRGGWWIHKENCRHYDEFLKLFFVLVLCPR